jgi:hypothetical protein
MRPEAFAHKSFAVTSNGERDRVHAMDMDDDRPGHDRVHAGLNRRPQAAWIGARIYEINRRRGAGIPIGNRFS